MKTQTLGQTGLDVSSLAYGAMRIAATWNPSEVDAKRVEAGKRSLRAAYEAGFTFFDHADIYCSGECERIHGLLFAEEPSLRSKTVLATKCGIRFPGDPNPDSPHRYDFSAEHILRSCESSLKRLQTDYIDLYQLHRPDFLMDPEDVAEAFAKLHAQGKVRYFGVSNFLPSKVAALQAYLDTPLVVNQVEIHLGRLDCLQDGTLDQCLEAGMTPLSWSPLAGGWLGAGGTPPESKPHLTDLVRLMDELADQMQVSRTEVALAWLLEHPARIVPIVGSTDADRIRSSVRATTVTIGRENWYRLLVAARGLRLP